MNRASGRATPKRPRARAHKKFPRIRTCVTTFPSRTAITVTGTHNPSSVNTCVIPALDPNAPTPASRRARGVTHARRRVAPLEYFDDDDVVNDDVVNADARIDNDINIAQMTPRRLAAAGTRADEDDVDGYIDRYKKYLCIRLYTVLYRINDGTVDTTPLCPSNDES